MNVFDQMGVYWAEIADQNPTQRQVQFVKSILKPSGLLLDLACGTGRHIIPLSKEGYDTVGSDISPNLLKIAKARLSSIQLVRADMRFLPFKPQAFAAAVSMDTSFGYLPSERDDMQSLKELRETLKQDGALIVDVFNRERLIQKYRENRAFNFKWALLPLFLKLNSRLAKWVLFRFFKWQEYPSFFLLQKRTVDANGVKLRDLWVVYDKAGGQIRVFRHVDRLYEPKGLKELLETAGFAVKRVCGDYEGQQFSLSSNRLILVASAK